MRIIGGDYKRKNLIAVPGNTARPTTDFMRETIFNTIDSCEGKRFLDLYAGSGAVGLEALSRGASKVVFIEFAIISLRTIQKNIENLDCRDRCNALRRKAASYVQKTDEKFDIIFMDPPYNKGLIKKTLDALEVSRLLDNEPLIIIEHSVKEDIPDKWKQRVLINKETRHKQFTIIK